MKFLFNNKFHYIIFRNKIFKIDLSNPKYREAMEYGISLGFLGINWIFRLKLKNGNDEGNSQKFRPKLTLPPLLVILNIWL